MKRIFFFLFTFIFCLGFIVNEHVFGQQYNFRIYSLEDGLSQSQVLSMCRDTRGNIWLGTFGNGASIFNGVDFQYLTIKDGIVNNNIRSLFEDSKGNMWIGTDGGLSIHNGYAIKNYTVGAGISSSKIQAIIEDATGRIWLGTKTGGINIYKDEKFEILMSDDGLLNNNVKALFEDNEARIWASCFGQGIVVFSGREMSYLSTANGLLDDEVNCFHQDKKGTIWIGSEKGITLISDFSNLEQVKPEYIMTGHAISAFYEDKEENLWIGTVGGGMMKYNGKDFLHITQANGLPENHIHQIIGDNSGGIWVGTDGGGACHYRGDAFITYTQKDGLCGNMVMAIQEDVPGNIWAGTDGNGLSNFSNGEFTNDFSKLGFNGKSIRAILEDNAGNLWIGSQRDGLYKYNGTKFIRYGTSDGFFLKDIYGIFQDSKSNIWIGGVGGAYVFADSSFRFVGKEAGLHKDKVYCINEDKMGNLWFATEHGLVKKMQNKIITFTDKDGLPSNFIATILVAHDDHLWLGTQNGISYYDGFKFQNYTVKDGLTSSTIFSLTHDDSGNLLVGTEKGFDKIFFSDDKKIQHIINYSAADGFIGMECNVNAVHKDKFGNVWFGTVKGLTKYNPKEEIIHSSQAQTVITNVGLFFEKTNWKEFSDTLTRWYNLPLKLQLPYNQNHLTFQFAATNLKMSEKAKYQFMLEGFDQTWSPLSRKHEATYSNIPPGKYTFRVKALSGSDTMEIPPAEFSFNVSPPFWETWWFYFLSGSLFLAAGYIILTLRTNALRQAKIRLEETVRVRTEEIMRQKDALENLSIVARETVQGVLVANGEANVEWMNEGLQRMTGYTFDEVKQILGYSLFQISSYPHIHNILRQVEETRKPAQYDSRHLTKQGIEQWVTATVTPVFEKNRLKKIVVIYTDITERKKIEEEIKRKNKDITESIMYAQQIQEAVLPPPEKLQEIIPESFILNLPRDIVSGDFYWFSKRGNTFIAAAADCTGHGVPGALMSMIGNEFLHQIVYQFDIKEPHRILDELDKRIKQSLRQQGKEKETKDGMDIALICLTTDNEKPALNDEIKMYDAPPSSACRLEYSGAHRPLVVISNKGELMEYESESVSIGGFMKTEKEFKTHTVPLHEGDTVYLFTDGYTDQFGGSKEKKFFMRGFKNLLLNIYRLPMNEQKEVLKKKFYEWKGSSPQTDDVLVIGLRFSNIHKKFAMGNLTF